MECKVMSLGHYCFIAETLRDISNDIGYYVRESSGIDWVNNFDGIKGLCRLFGHSLEKNIKEGKWLEDSWWCDLKPCQSIWNMYFPHEDLNNIEERQKIIKRLEKLYEYGKQSNQFFMYLLREDENNKECLDYFAKICNQLNILDKVIIVGKSDFIHQYREYNTELRFNMTWFCDLAYNAYTRPEDEWDSAQASIRACLEYYGII